jgi:hypothetical protein
MSTFGGEGLVPDFAAPCVFLLVTGHEKGHAWFQERVPRALGDRGLAAIDGFDSLWVGNGDLVRS